MPLRDYIIHVFCLIDDIYLDLFANKRLRKYGYMSTLQDSELITMLIVGDNYFPNIELVRYKTFNKQATNLLCVIRYMYAELMKKFNNCDL